MHGPMRDPMRNLILAAGLIVPALALTAHGAPVERQVSWQIDATAFTGTLVYDDAGPPRRPGIVMVPNWMGPTPAATAMAVRIAASDYVVLVADMYGNAIRPTNADQAGAAAAAVRADRNLMRARIQKAVDVLAEQARTAPLDPARIAAVGFCFGGGTVLELARSGRELAGVVSFHGSLDTPLPARGGAIPTPVLVLHGADDPFVPDADVAAFRQEMRAAGADWQLVSYGGAVHAFAEPDAAMPGQAEYHPLVARRAFAAMRGFLAERFAAGGG